MQAVKIVEDLLSVNEYTRPGRMRPDTLAVILHWVGNPGTTAKMNRDFFEFQVPKLEQWASAHYVVGLEGEVVHCVPDDEMAYHVGSDRLDPASGRIYTDWAREHFGKYAVDYETWSPNCCTIGIELCHIDWEGRFTKETLESARELCAKLCREWELDPMRDIGTHFGVVGWKRCPKWFAERPQELEEFKEQVRRGAPRGFYAGDDLAR